MPFRKTVSLFVALLCISPLSLPPSALADDDGDGQREHKNKIILESVTDAPDPFSAVVSGQAVFDAQFDVRKTDGLGSHSGRREKEFFVEHTLRIAASSQEVVLTGQAEIPVPLNNGHAREDDDDENKYIPVSVTENWDGKDAGGVFLADGLYTYEMSGTLIRVKSDDESEKAEPKTKIIAVSNTLSGSILLDNTPPVIFDIVPADGATLTDARPAVSASYTDPLSGIDVNTVILKLDAADVTAQADVTPSLISFTPNNDLSAQTHTIEIQVKDQAGNPAMAVNHFTVVPSNLPPVLAPIGNRRIDVGSVLTIELQATDPDGDPLQFDIAPVPLAAHAGFNKATGVFTFAPEAAQAGNIPVTFGVSDGTFSVGESIVITVEGIPANGVTGLTGRLLDTNAFVSGQGEIPVVGAVISILGSGKSAVTDGDGQFILSGIPSGKQVFDINTAAAALAPDGSGYAGFREEIDLKHGVTNVITRPFFLPRIDGASVTPVDPARTMVVHNPNLGITMTVPPHTAKNAAGTDFTGSLSISIVPEGLAPAVMPEEYQPGMVITIQPIGVSYAAPAPVTFPNFDNLTPGSEVDLWSLDAGQGIFVVVGTGVVSADGSVIETVSGGIMANDWHFFLPALLGLPGAGNGFNENPANACQAALGSSAVLCTGNLRETHTTVGYRSLGQTRALSFTYNSTHADPRPILRTNVTIPARSAVPLSLSAGLTVAGVDQGVNVFTGTGGLSESVDETLLQAVQFDASNFPTGLYPYRLRISSNFRSSSVAGNVNNFVLVNNQSAGPFGAGWGLEGLEHLDILSNGDALVTDGNGAALVFRSSRAGTALSFDGGDVVTVGNTTPLFQNTVEAWVRPSGLAANIVMAQQDGSSPACGAGIFLFAGGNDVCYDLNPAGCGTSGLICAQTNILNQWTHIAGTFDGITQRLYVNGQEVNSRLGAAFTPRGYLMIGAARFFSGHQALYQGDIDELRVWNHARSGPEILSGMNQNINPNEPDLAGYWKFNEGQGQIAGDSSVNNRAGVLGTNANPQSNDPAWIPSGASLGCRGQCTFQSPAGDFSVFAEDGGGTFTRTLKDGTKIHFDAQGRHTSSVDRNGNPTLYGYDSQGLLTSVTDPAGLVTTLNYTFGALSSVTDPVGRTTVFDHDAAGNLTRVIDPEGTARHFGYDTRHRMIAQTNKRGVTTDYQYDFAGRVVQSRLPDGSTRQITAEQTVGLVDLSGGVGSAANPAAVARPSAAVARFTDGNSNVTTFGTDSFGAATTTTDALGRTTTIARDANSNPTQITQPNGAVTTITYDARGNLLTTTDQSISATTTFTYEPNFNQVTSIRDPKLNTTTIGYDTNGNPVAITDALSNQITMAYNAQGLLTSTTDALGGTTGFSYDARGNLITTTDPLGHSTTLTYDAAGNVIRSTDAQGNVTNFTYDTMNRLIRVTDALGGITNYAYDAAGNLTQVTDARDNFTIFEYDSQNRLVKTTDPLGKFETFSYDANGNLLQTTDRGLQTLDFQYDVVNQLIQKTLPGNLATTFAYDTVGNLTSVADPDSALSFAYDGASRLTGSSTTGSPTQPAVTLNHSYDKNGNRLTMTDGIGGTTGYTHDALNRLFILDPPSSSPINFSYDALSRRILTTLPNGVTTNYSYDAASQLTNLVHQLGATTLSSFGYTYDKVGNRVTSGVQRSGVSVQNNLSYVYDNLYRLTQATNPLPAIPDETFQYDSLGNRLLRDGQSTSAVFDAANRLLSDENVTYTYDNNGNLIRKTATGTVTDYLYDAENQLIEIKTNGVTTATYAYDGLGRRIQKDVGGNITRYIYDNEDILLEYDGGSTGSPLNTLQARYTHGAGIDEPLVMERGGQNYYYHVDGLGSITDLTDSTGAVVQSYAYDSFGRIVQQAGSLVNPYTYTGREYDSESELYFYRSRYYDPESGRFLQEDSVRFVDGINTHNYVGSNPINFVDSIGNKKQKPGIYYFWGPCGAAETAECIVQCGDRGVKSCKVRFKIQVTIKDGKPIESVTQLGTSCNCNEDGGGGGNNTTPTPIPTCSIGPIPLPIPPPIINPSTPNI